MTNTSEHNASESLACPIMARRAAPVATHRAQAEAIEWSRRIGLTGSPRAIEWVAAWNVAEFAAHVYPEATDLSLAAEWILWMDVVDDTVESMTADQITHTLAPLTRILDSDAPEADASAAPLTQAFGDLWRRTRTGMSPTWRQRVATTWVRCANSMQWEAANRAAGRPPLLDDYLANRATAGATYVALLLTEGLSDYELPGPLHRCGPLSTLRILAADHICWVNDLFSLDRETRRGDVHNLVLVLERTYRCDRHTAVTESIRMANERMATIVALTESVPAYSDDCALSPQQRRLLSRAVDDLLQWTAGSMAFHRISTRHLDHHTGRDNPFHVTGPAGAIHTQDL
ncbi:terpene synthase family protein [Nocardia thraciensis]